MQPAPTALPLLKHVNLITKQMQISTHCKLSVHLSWAFITAVVVYMFTSPSPVFEGRAKSSVFCSTSQVELICFALMRCYYSARIIRFNCTSCVCICVCMCFWFCHVSVLQPAVAVNVWQNFRTETVWLKNRGPFLSRRACLPCLSLSLCLSCPSVSLSPPLSLLTSSVPVLITPFLHGEPHYPFFLVFFCKFTRHHTHEE